MLPGEATHINQKLSGNLKKKACALRKKSIAPAVTQLLTEYSFHSRDRSCLLDDNLEAKWRILPTSNDFIFTSLQCSMIF